MLAALFLATLIGCSPQLKPNLDITSYYVTLGAEQTETLLCGITPSGEACLRMQDGPKLKAVLKGSILNWLSHLKDNKTTTAKPGKNAYLLSTMQGAQLLQALTVDNRHREFERWVQRYDYDARIYYQ